jgi:cell division protein ZapA
MEQISIKVIVAGRTYPLTVNKSEEEIIMKAAEEINKSIKALQDSYAVKDMQDLLAMTALQYGAKLSVNKGGSSESTPVIDPEIEKSLDLLLTKLSSI